jgi:putative inorganic carbon (HCO3(-)) transporter
MRKLPKIIELKNGFLPAFQYLLLFFVLLIPFSDHSRMSILYNKILPVRILLLILFLLSLILVGRAILKGSLKLPQIVNEVLKDNIVRALIALWVIRLVSLAQSHNIGASLELFGFFSAMIGLYILMKYVILPSRFYVVQLVRAYVYVGLAIGLYGLFQYFYFKLFGRLLPGVLVGGDYIRLPGTFFDANHFAAYLATIAPLTIAFAWLSKNAWMKAVWWVSYFFLSFVILYSFSRSGLLALLMSSALMLSLGIRSGYYRKILPLLAALALGGLVVFVSNATGRSLLDRAQSIFDLDEPSTKAHYLLLRGEVELFLENPVFGIGYGSFSEKFRQSETGQEHSRVDPADVRIPAHSVWFEVITETGLLGFLAYFSFVIIIIRSLVKTIRTSKNKTVRIYSSAFLSGLAGVWTGGLFYSYNLEFFWFFIFLGYLFTLVMQSLLKEGVIVPDGEKKETLNWLEIIPAASIILIAGYVIIYRLGINGIVSNEAHLATSAKEMYHNPNWLIPTLYREPYFGYPPLFSWLSTHLIHLYASTPTLIVRLIPALFGIGVVFLTYYLGRILTSRYWGMIASLTVLFITPFVYLTRSVNTEIVAAFFIMSAALTLLLSKQRAYLLVFAGVLLGLAGMVDGVLTMLTLPVFLILVIYLQPKLLLQKRLLNLSLIVFLLIVLPWHIFALISNPNAFMQTYFRLPNFLVFIPVVTLGLVYFAANYYERLKLKFDKDKNIRLAIPVFLIASLVVWVNLPFISFRMTPPEDNNQLVELVRSHDYLERAREGLLLNGVSRKVVGYYSDYSVTEVGNFDIEKAIINEDQVLLITSSDRGDILVKKFAREEHGLRLLKRVGMLDLLANY